MIEFLIYALKTILGLGIFALVYRLIFLEERNFKLRRVYLLISVFLSFALPLLSLNFVQVFAQAQVNTIIFDEITIYSSGIKNISKASSIPFHKIFTICYFVIFSLLLAKIVIQIIKVNINIRKYNHSVFHDVKLIRIPTANTSYSFFKNIFIGETPGKHDFEKILAHERIHAVQLHTIDVIFIELLTVIFWFNPVIWWYKTEIKNVHEYLADEGALDAGFNQKSYQITLLEHLIGSASLSITNNFNYSLIKNRIAMMNKEKNSKKNNWKILLIFPISLLLVLAFACTKKTDDKNSGIINESTEIEMAYYEPEVMAEFKDGVDGARMFIAKNLKYPPKAIENGVSAKIMVTFVVSSEGEIITDVEQFNTDTNGTIGEGVTVISKAGGTETNNNNNEECLQLLKDESLRVVKMLPVVKPAMKDGKPVNSVYTFPINFALQ